VRVVGLSAEQRERQRIEDCRELYLKHGGEDHELIEHEMRAMGHKDFHRRILYRRYERGNCDTGWIERFGWNRLLPPPSTGGAALPPDERKGCALPEGPNNISGGSASNAGTARNHPSTTPSTSTTSKSGCRAERRRCSGTSSIRSISTSV